MRVGSAPRRLGYIVAIITIASCSSSSSKGSTTSTSATQPTAAVTTDSIPVTTAPAVTTRVTNAGLVGTWYTDVAALVAVGAEQTAALRDLTCTGPVTLTFNEGGTFEHASDFTCRAGNRTGSGTFRGSGTYALGSDATTLTISNTTSQGAITFNGSTTPFDPTLERGTVTVSLTESILSVASADGDANRTINYTR